MGTCIKELYRIGIAPVAATEDTDDALPLTEALKKGGVSAIEITFRTEVTAEALRTLTREIPDMIVGVGTAVTRTQADTAIAVGTKLIVSPGFQPALIAYVQEKDVAMCPDTMTSGETEQTMPLGLGAVKFFPAGQSGGPAMLKTLSAPYRNLRFMLTGGMTLENLQRYFVLKQVFVYGDIWLTKKENIRAHALETVTACTHAIVHTTLSSKIKHAGIGSKDDVEAKRNTSPITSVFDLDYIETPVFSFSGTAVEVMEYQGEGSLGHIAIGMDDTDRVGYCLAKCGVRFDESTCKVDNLGRSTFLHLKGEIGGLAFHLVENWYAT